MNPDNIDKLIKGILAIIFGIGMIFSFVYNNVLDGSVFTILFVLFLVFAFSVPRPGAY
jgi:uncharacterized membrane protein